MPPARKTRSAARSLKDNTLGFDEQPVVFAPNVTPVSYLNDDYDDCNGEHQHSVFAPQDSDGPVLPMNPKRRPPRNRRPSQQQQQDDNNHIPRPPNAFILFRRALLTRQYTPGSLDTATVGHLSKIVGSCWRALPHADKRSWYLKAKEAKKEHEKMHPGYRFTPVHGKKTKAKSKAKKALPNKEESPEQDRTSEQVAQLMLTRRKGSDFSKAAREISDKFTFTEPAVPEPPAEPVASRREFIHRRSSSVPIDALPSITLPSVQFFPQQEQQNSGFPMLYGRRPSSAGSRLIGNFNPAEWQPAPGPRVLQRDDSPLPDVTPGLFEQVYMDAAANNTFPTFPQSNGYPLPAYHHEIFNPRHELPPLGPLDVSVAPHEIVSASSYAPSPASLAAGWFDAPGSHASSAYSGSPTLTPEPTDIPLPMQNLTIGEGQLPIVSPQPQHVPTTSDSLYQDLWSNLTAGKSFSLPTDEGHHQLGVQYDDYKMADSNDHAFNTVAVEDMNMFVANNMANADASFSFF